MRLIGGLYAAWLTTAGLHAQVYKATGLVIEARKVSRSLVVSCDEIPGYMAAMEMSFRIDRESSHAQLKPGTSIEFLMEERNHVFYARNIRVVTGANLESEPMQAGGLAVLQNALKPTPFTREVPQGGLVQDFELTDQAGKKIRLSSLKGKVVLLTFGYSRCPNPEYCFRLSNNLSRVRQRFASRIPRDIVLLTIAIDPEHDQGATLAAYARVWKADPASWHFLTGPLPEIKEIAAMFGMSFWREEGLLTHSLHTVILDQSGRVAANLEGNRFTVQQLGDLVQEVLEKDPEPRVGQKQSGG